MKMMDGAAMAGMAFDARSLDELKREAGQNQQGSVRKAARQFEAMFAQQMLSQMRQTSLAGKSGLEQALNSPASKTWRGMMDQQLAQKIAGLPGADGVMPEHSGLGLADMLEKQLTRQTVSAESVRRAGLPLSMSTLELARRALAPLGSAAGPLADAVQDASAAEASPATARQIQNGKFGTPAGYQAAPAADPRSSAAAAVAAAPQSPEEVRAAFLGRFLPAARRAEAATGIPAAYILGQAALESGWGRHEIRSADGRPSHNLFGIKSTGWKGRSVQTVTTEYEGGRKLHKHASFRAYDSYEEAFEDYARMLSTNPRYTKALSTARNAEQFAQGLQRAGYATDPHYARKLSATIRHAMRVVI